MKYLITALCSLLLHSPALANPAVLLGPDLEPQRITFRGLAADGVRIADRFGETKTLPAEQVLRLSFTPSAKSERVKDAATVRLADGQVLVGRWVGPGEDDASIRLALSAVGKELDVSLDDVLSVTLRDGVEPPRAEDDDIVLLATGETLSGFIEAVNVGSIDFIVGDADEPIELPLERVHGFAIANTPRPIQPDADQRLARVTLGDGSSYVLKSPETAGSSSPGALRLTGLSVLPLAVPVVSLPMQQVTRIEPLAADRTLSPLAGFDYTVAEGGEVFGVPMPPRPTPDGALKLHAPVALDYDLPDGASRVAFSIGLVLGDEVAPSHRALAGCELVVYDGEQVIERSELLPDTPSRRINLPLKSADLRIELKPGVNGPVLDRVLLSEAELLVTPR